MVLATKIIVGGAAPFARVSLGGGGGALIMWRQRKKACGMTQIHWIPSLFPPREIPETKTVSDKSATCRRRATGSEGLDFRLRRRRRRRPEKLDTKWGGRSCSTVVGRCFWGCILPLFYSKDSRFPFARGSRSRSPKQGAVVTLMVSSARR